MLYSLPAPKRSSPGAAAARFLKYCFESAKRRADSLVRTGPPGPVLRQWEQPHASYGKPARGPVADQGVRPISAKIRIDPKGLAM
jgi:hypothetical protein